MNGKLALYDRKNPLAEAFWNTVNKMVVGVKFGEIEVSGREIIPRSGPFLLVCNHISRWDGLVVRRLIDRSASYMVSPNELRGFQGSVLRSVGAIPANPRYDLVSFFRRQVEAGEGLVIFPEGDVYRDRSTHPFKNGAARLALTCADRGLLLPVIPLAIAYDDEGPSPARVAVGSPVEVEPYVRAFAEHSNIGIRSLTVRLEREVHLLRQSLAAVADSYQVVNGRANKRWVPRGLNSVASQESPFSHASRSGGRILLVEDGLSDRDRAQASTRGLLGQVI